MASGYLVIAVLLTLTLGFGIVALALGSLLRPSRPFPEKSIPYESGITPIGDARVRVSSRFYLVAMLFVLFDIETVFLYPWAVAFDTLGLYGLVEAALFVAILLVAYFYAWRKGALEWT
jgi:NADH-quinone oxidoreductase subunit A